MGYLLSVYWLWLLAAFFLALLVGVLVNPCGTREWGAGKAIWIIALLAFLVMLILVLQVIRGLTGHWFEMAAMFAFVFALGLVLGCVLSESETETGAEESLPIAQRLEPSVSQEPPASPAPAPPLANEAEFAGSRPPGFVIARHGRADDLKLISGIGKQNEGRLHGLGIWHFDQIAAWTPDNVIWVGSYLSFPGRIDRERWVEQAKALAAGQMTDFASRAAAGKVASSRDDGDRGSDNVLPVIARKVPRGNKPDPV